MISLYKINTVDVFFGYALRKIKLVLTVSSFSMSLLLVLCTMLPEVIRLPSPAITDIFTRSLV